MSKVRGARIDDHNSHPKELKEGEYRILYMGSFQDTIESQEIKGIDETNLRYIYKKLKEYFEPSEVIVLDKKYEPEKDNQK